MIRAWIKFDDFWLKRGDQLVLWLWNELGVPWRKFVRGFCLVWLATQVIIEVQWEGGWNVGVIIWPLVYLFFWAFDEIYIASNTVEAVYARYEAMRSAPPLRFIRFSFWIILPLTDLHRHHVISEEVRDALFVLWLYVVNSLPPLHPRAKKRKPVTVLRPALNLGSN